MSISRDHRADIVDVQAPPGARAFAPAVSDTALGQRRNTPAGVPTDADRNEIVVVRVPSS